jgi:hypothetical protein
MPHEYFTKIKLLILTSSFIDSSMLPCIDHICSSFATPSIFNFHHSNFNFQTSSLPFSSAISQKIAKRKKTSTTQIIWNNFLLNLQTKHSEKQQQQKTFFDIKSIIAYNIPINHSIMQLINQSRSQFKHFYKIYKPAAAKNVNIDFGVAQILKWNLYYWPSIKLFFSRLFVVCRIDLEAKRWYSEAYWKWYDQNYVANCLLLCPI